MQASQASVLSEQSQNEDSDGNISPTIVDIPSSRDSQHFDRPEIDIAVNISGKHNIIIHPLFSVKEILASCSDGYTGVGTLSVNTYSRGTTSKLVVQNEDENVNRNVNRNGNVKKK